MHSGRCRPERGHHTEHYPCEHGEPEGEADDRAVQAYLLHPGEVRPARPRAGPQCGRATPAPTNPPMLPKHQVFGEDLARDRNATRLARCAPPVRPRVRRRARATGWRRWRRRSEDESDGAENHPEWLLQVTDDGLEERRHAGAHVGVVNGIHCSSRVAIAESSSCACGRDAWTASRATTVSQRAPRAVAARSRARSASSSRPLLRQATEANAARSR